MSPQPPDQPPGLARRVLLIMDEQLVAMLIEDMLDDLGYEVIDRATRLAEALEKARTLSFDVAIVNTNLAGERTFQVADVLTARGLGFVFATGYAPSSLPPSVRRMPILRKPFGQDDLARALAAALG
jgi:CheY-like chemotaxis protein